MYRDILLAVLLAVAALTPGDAEATVQTAPTVQPEAEDKDIVVTGDKPNPDKKVCRRRVPTGSIMPKVTCRTASEWEEETARSVEHMERLKADQETQRFVKDAIEAKCNGAPVC